MLSSTRIALEMSATLTSSVAPAAPSPRDNVLIGLVYSPTRASILTGQLPTQHGVGWALGYHGSNDGTLVELLPSETEVDQASSSQG